MPAKRDSDLIADAMAETQHERFAQAWDQDGAVHDETGDTSLERHDNDQEGRELEAADQNIGDDVAEVEVEAAGEGDEKPEGAASEVAPKAVAKDGEQPRIKGKFAKKEDAEIEGDEKAGAAEADAKPDEHGRIPAGVVREKTKALEAKIAERDAKLADSDRRFSELNGKFDLLLRQNEQRQQQQQPPKVDAKADVEPDMFADPDGWKSWNRRQTEAALASIKQENQAQLQEVTHRIVGQSFDVARGLTPESQAKFDAAFNGLMGRITSGDREALLVKDRLFSSQTVNPGAELMRWHRQQEMLAEFGNDPDALQKKIDAALEAKLADPEFKKSTLAKWKGEAAGENGQAPRHIIRPAVPMKSPPSLNGAAGSAALTDAALQAALNDPSDAGRFNRAWEVDPDA